jgi:protein PhnA
MTIEERVRERSGNECELCSNVNDLSFFEVQPTAGSSGTILICGKCREEINTSSNLDANHWRCLNTSMWNTEQAVQVMVWRLLTKLQKQGNGWAQDLLDQLYLDDETLAWAKTGNEDKPAELEAVVHKDSNGNVLASGDTVVLIKDLDVKGGGFTAKRGTAVRGISLVENNASQIEGKVNGQQIVILTQYVKKST